jgi:hypothetical protein
VLARAGAGSSLGAPAQIIPRDLQLAGETI